MKVFYFVILGIIVFTKFNAACAQAPAITYNTPQTYVMGTAITPLAPTNSGGAVPATIYGQVTTFAGSGNIGSADGTGTAASFYHPYALTMDGSGNFYVADSYNQLIRKVSPAGIVTTIAGNGVAGFANGTGTGATFNYPGGITIDASGNLYVGDQTNNLIRKITPAGLVSTYAGNGSIGSANGNANSASFSSPAQVIFDGSGNLYIADRNNNMIRKITPAGIVSTFAGNGTIGSANGTGISATFFGAGGVAIDQFGNIYVSDSLNNLIRKITPAGVVTTIAGSGAQGTSDGIGTSASFHGPFGLTVDQRGNIYVADDSNHLIRRISASGNVTTLAGTGIPGAVDGIGTSASVNYPTDVKLDGLGNLYFTEFGNNKIRKIIVTGYTIDKPLPTGLSFDQTTGIISGTPAVLSPATIYTVTAYNVSGSSSTQVSIAVVNKQAQTITFNPIATKVYGTADFAAGATASSGLPVAYSSSNPLVATMSASGTIHITGVGTTTFTASQSGNAAYLPATAVTQNFTVTPAALTVTADNKARLFGITNPTLTATITGFVYGETPAVFTVQPVLTTTATISSPVGVYPINVSSIVAANYTFTYIPGTLTIGTIQDVTVAVFPVVTPNGDGVNDVLHIDNIGNYPDNHLVLVNRNGVKIFDVMGYNNTSVAFDGHSNITGIFQQQGTYFYNLEYTANGLTKKKTGFVILKY